MSVSFGGKYLPTKLELIRIRRSLQVAQNVYRILEDKRDILVRRLNELIEEAEEARRKLMEPLTKAYDALHESLLIIGPLRLQSIATNVPETVSVRAKSRTIMGINIPTVELDGGKIGLTYGFADTTVSLDEAASMFRELVGVICKAAELENAIFRLAEELKKTQRLLNALQHVVIPRYKDAIKFISMTLEERERDDFVKLKHIKRRFELREERAHAS
ncbi:MAG: V-type ATP synthase subunit D [Nitrososphaerota archaeon]|nr:V-type ATP synthase subunit D [Aigarchaeota archaeon]MDW8076076.1 V-type ATP synthase subunit D [Nitrososphaerota archaeon]